MAYNEGQTATGPNGEKIVYSGGAWGPAQAPAQAPEAGGPPAFIPGVPKPVKPPEPKTTFRTLTPNEVAQRGLNPQRAYQESSEGKIDDLGDLPKPGADNASDAATKLRGVIDKIDSVAIDSADNSGWFETGFTGSVARKVPGTAGYGLAADIETIDANTAFEALNQMRQNSPTGGALGNVTEMELKLLKSSISNLDTAQSQEDFLKNLAIAKTRYLDMLRKIDPAGADEYKTKPGIRFGEKGETYLTTLSGNTDNQERVDPLGVLNNPAPPTGGGGNPIAAGFGDIVEGAGDIAGIVGNPLNATINAVAGTDLSTDLGKTLRGAFGLPKGNPTIGAINQGATAAMTGGLAARGAATLARPGGVMQNALAMFGANPARDGVAGGAAALGAEVARRNDIGPAGQVGAAVLGGMAGYGGANAAINAFAPKAPNALAQAASRQGVDLLPADAGGGAVRGMTAGAKASPISVDPIVKAAQNSRDQLSQAASRTAGAQGRILPTDEAGQGVRSAAERFTRQTAERGGKMYDRAAATAKGVKTIKPRLTMAALDEQIARASQNPADDGFAKELKTLRESLAGGVSIQGLRDARTKLSQGVYDGKLRSSMDQGVYKAVLGNIADDIEAGLISAGKPEAAATFRRADKFWSERVEHIDKVLQPILGKDRSGEQIVQSLETMARGGNGGNARLSRLLANMTREESGNIRATLVDRIGRATPGQQNADGTAFSASTFLTNWSKMTPQAKASLFGNQDLRKNLDDIARIAEGSKGAQAAANHSNTGSAILGNVGVQGSLAVASLPSFLLGMGAQFLTGKLLASPGFARWLARSPQNPQATRKYSEQLGVLATREPLIATDVKALQQHLQQSFGQSPMRAAAGEEEQD